MINFTSSSSSAPSKKRLLSTKMESFFRPTTKEAASAEAFNNLSTSPNGLVLNITKPVVPKNPVGRPLKKLKQVALAVPTDIAARKEELTREAHENYMMTANDTLELNATKSYATWSDSTKALLKFYCHKWGGYNNLEHIGWQEGSYVIDKVKEIFSEASEKTIRNKITLEKKAEKDGNVPTLANKLRPNLNALFQIIDQDNKKSIYE